MPPLISRALFSFITFVAIATFTLYAYSANFEHQRAVPEMCGDIFGYTNMSRAITAGKLFGDITPRPYLDELLKIFKDKGFAFEEYYETVTPYAYHVDDLSGRIINQYPPGTAMLLTVLPLKYRLYFFPVLVVLLFVMISLAAPLILTRKSSWLYVNAILFVTFWLVMVPRPLFNLYDVNSISPTYGLLVAAGLALVLRPKWAFALLGLATLFRVSSIIFTLPFFLIYFYRLRNQEGRGLTLTRECCLDFSKKTLASAGLFLLGGYGLYLLYVWKLTGSPLQPTYPFYDREFSGINDLIFNLHYFSLSSPYFIFDLIALGLVGLMTFRDKKHWLFFAVGIVLYNYVFFILHRVWVDNYVYATAFINLGVGLAHLFRPSPRTEEKRLNLINYASSALVLVCLLFTLSRLQLPDQDPAELYNEYRDNYAKVFAGYDVVWAHLRGGTIEYLLDKPTLNYNDGSQPVKDETLLWMYNHGYRQAIWVTDIFPELANDLARVLPRLHLPYRVRRVDDNYFGTILEINPRP